MDVSTGSRSAKRSMRCKRRGRCNRRWNYRGAGGRSGVGLASRWPHGTLYPQKLALTLQTSGGRSVGTVRSRTQATEFRLFFFWVEVLISHVLLLGDVYLAWGDFAMGPTGNSIRFCANLAMNATETLQLLGKRPYTDSSNSPRPKRARQVKSKVKSMIIIFFYIKGVTHKEFVLADRTVNSAYYCDALRPLRETVWRLRP
jgi:hypothetical protein